MLHIVLRERFSRLFAFAIILSALQLYAGKASAQTIDSVYWDNGWSTGDQSQRLDTTIFPNIYATTSSNIHVPANACLSDTGNIEAPNDNSNHNVFLGYITDRDYNFYNVMGDSIECYITVDCRTGGFNADTTSYISFLVAPANGYAVNIKGISFDIGRYVPEPGSPVSYAVSTSVGGYGNTIGTGTINGSGFWDPAKKTITGLNIQGAPGTPVTVRIYGYDATQTDVAGTLLVQNVTINYTVTAPPTTVTISDSSFCAGASLSIPYMTGNTYNAGNVFTAQLSNASGSFANAVNIGTLASTAPGTINATIPANTPAGNGYRIRVISSSPADTGADNGNNLAIHSLTTPAVSIAATDTTICIGTAVTFTATDTNAGTMPIYQWRKNGSSVGTSTNTYTDNNLANGDVVSCVIISNAPCITTQTVTSNTITITVNTNAAPTVQISTNNNNNAVCQGTPTTFMATPGNGGSTPVYQWKKNGTNVGSNSSTYTDASLGNGDIISCVLTSSSLCAIPSTAASNEISVDITPTVTPTIAINVATTNICAGTPVTFIATALDTGSTPVYQWKKNGANVGNNSTLYTDATLNNGDVVSCTVTSNATCITATTATASITMTVAPIVTPVVTISAAPGDTICAGTVVTFTAIPVNGGTPPVYEWKKNGLPVGNNSPAYTDATLNNSDVITCNLTNNATCVATPTVTSNAISMTVNANVTPAVTINATDAIICAGTTVTFIATATNSGTSIFYQWAKNGMATGTNSSFYTDATLSSGDMISCTTTSNATCTTSPTAISNTVTMTVNTPPVPIIIADGNELSTTIPFTAYSWGRDNVGISGATSSSYTPTQNGNYTVTVTDSNGCTATSAPYNIDTIGLGVTNVSNATAIKIYPNPTTNTVNIIAPVPVTADITSIDGKTILHQEHTQAIDISNLADGMYIIIVRDSNNNVVKIEKLVKE